MSIYEFFILDSLNSFLLMSFLASSTFFTILGIIAIYLRHKPSQVVTAVVKKRFQNLISFGIKFQSFLKKGEKETIRPEIQAQLASQLSDNLLILYIFRIARIER